MTLNGHFGLARNMSDVAPKPKSLIERDVADIASQALQYRLRGELLSVETWVP